MRADARILCPEGAVYFAGCNIASQLEHIGAGTLKGKDFRDYLADRLRELLFSLR